MNTNIKIIKSFWIPICTFIYRNCFSSKFLMDFAAKRVAITVFQDGKKVDVVRFNDALLNARIMKTPKERKKRYFDIKNKK